MDRTLLRSSAPYRYLGVFRLLLASLVMLQHAGALLPGSIGSALVPLEVGGIAVFCFFVVSGFVIAEAVDVFYAGRPGAFLLNRLLRLGPTYLIAVVITAGILALVAPVFVPGPNEVAITPDRYAPQTIALNLFALLPAWRAVGAHWHAPDILEPVWALRVEMFFYLVMAGCVLGAGVARVAVGPVLAIAGTAALLLITLLDSRANGSLLENVPYFVLGTAFYHLLSRPAERLLTGAFCLSCCAFAAVHLLGRPPVFGLADFARDRTGELALLATLTLGFAVLACIPEGCGRAATQAARIDRLCGEVTYPLYLLHWSVLLVAKTYLPHERWASVVLAFCCAYATAGLAVILIERPVARLRSVIRRRRSVGAPDGVRAEPAAG